MFLGEEKSASELSFAEHLGTVRGYEFLTTQEGDVLWSEARVWGHRRGERHVSVAIAPAWARWGPSE